MAQSRRKSKAVVWGGFDLSTTGLGLGVRSERGEEAYVHTKMRGATAWKRQPAFDIEQTPKMMAGLLDELEEQGWELGKASWSFAVRQHDMVLLDSDGQVLMPALSWQCDAASSQVEQLRRQGAEQVVGRVEERFILPKLMWALASQQELRNSVAQVMTTGDWIALMLTGKARLSTSDAISNGLLDQNTKRLAVEVIQDAGLKPQWFPEVIQSGKRVGTINPRSVPGASDAWMDLKARLTGSKIVSSLGDNHATGVGCGLEEGDFETIVVSAGTSGTINRVCPANAPLVGNAACFEFFKHRMLLMMLADCCKWYDRFISRYAEEYSGRLDELDAELEQAEMGEFRRVLHLGGKEYYAPDWDQLTTVEQAASTQLSIMLELLLRTRAMLAEVKGAETVVSRYVLTGGLSQSRFFQEVFTAGVQLLSPKAKVLINARKGPLRYQTAAYGALLNAMRPADKEAAIKLCPTRTAARPSAARKKILQYWLRAFGL